MNFSSRVCVWDLLVSFKLDFVILVWWNVILGLTTPENTPHLNPTRYLEHYLFGKYSFIQCLFQPSGKDLFYVIFLVFGTYFSWMWFFPIIIWIIIRTFWTWVHNVFLWLKFIWNIVCKWCFSCDHCENIFSCHVYVNIQVIWLICSKLLKCHDCEITFLHHDYVNIHLIR